MKNSVCCVIVTYNAGENFYNCFNSIKSQVEEIVIVDNNSNKDTLDILDKINEENINTFIIYNKENLGIAVALNQGVKHALKKQYTWILTMDHDSIATEHMILSMLNTYESLGSKLKEEIKSIFPDHIEKGFEKNLKNITSNKDMKEYVFVPYEITSGNLIHVSAFNKIGFFDESLFIDMVDTDFCMRLNEAGIKLIKVKNSKLIHNIGDSQHVKFLFMGFDVSAHSPIRRYYMTRNRLYIWKKYSYLNLDNIKLDKKLFKKELIKIILGEKEKKEKLKMLIKGYIDYKKGIKGKLNYSERK